MNINKHRLIIIVSILYLSYLGNGFLYAQQECEVEDPALVGSYEGECKKGKAHGVGKAVGKDTYEGEFKKGLPEGAGTYTWANGNVFAGTFKKGLKVGEGRLTFSPESFPDSILTGFWKDDFYVGLYEFPYKVLSKTSPVNRIVIRKLGEAPNHIAIKGEMEMLREKGLNTVYFTGSGFDNVQYPFTGEMEASNANVPFSFKFIIYQPGRWEVVVHFD